MKVKIQRDSRSSSFEIVDMKGNILAAFWNYASRDFYNWLAENNAEVIE